MRNLTYLAGRESNREANVDSCRLAFCSLYLLIIYSRIIRMFGVLPHFMVLLARMI